MPHRVLSGEALQFRLSEEIERTQDQEILARSGRNARTLLKDGALRITVITLAPDGGIPEHQAEGPLVVQVLRGRMTFTIGTKIYDLAEGDALAVPGRVDHAVHSVDGASFLLTIAHVGH